MNTPHSQTNAELAQRLRDSMEGWAQELPSLRVSDLRDFVRQAADALERQDGPAEREPMVPVAYVIQAVSDNSIRDELAILGWHNFDKKLEEMKNDGWVKAGTGRIIPLYRALKNAAPQEQRNTVGTGSAAQPARASSLGEIDADAVSERGRWEPVSNASRDADYLSDGMLTVYKWRHDENGDKEQLFRFVCPELPSRPNERSEP